MELNDVIHQSLTVLTGMEKSPFFNLVRTHTITGFFASPVHGGTRTKSAGTTRRVRHARSGRYSVSRDHLEHRSDIRAARSPAAPAPGSLLNARGGAARATPTRAPAFKDEAGYPVGHVEYAGLSKFLNAGSNALSESQGAGATRLSRVEIAVTPILMDMGARRRVRDQHHACDHVERWRILPSRCPCAHGYLKWTIRHPSSLGAW